MTRLLALLTVAAFALPAGQSYRDTLRRMEKQIFDEVNDVRVRRGLKRLQWDEKLAAMAREHAINMAGRRFFSHVDPVLGDIDPRLAKHEIRPKAAGENLFMSQGYDQPVPEAIEQWMNSPGHRKNILGGAYTHTGVGAAYSSDGNLYFVQEFALPLPATAPSSR